ncbi:MAG TPA: substrate-binding domain-containing protein [Candidatus Sulfotelmatobacter sp.]|nr:substrate-binding domain-containing protein [Candidatus Sulfotelmatobacter sp.]
MKIRSVYLAAFVLASLTPCFAHHTAVVVNKGNAVENVTSAHLAKVIRGEIKKWPNGKNILLVLHKESSGETETLERLNKMSAAEWKAFLVAHRDSIVFVETDADVLKTVQAEPGAVGFIEVHSVDNTVNVVHVDGKLPMEFGYLPH